MHRMLVNARLRRAFLIFLVAAAALWYGLPSVPSRVIPFPHRITAVSPDARLVALEAKEGVVEVYELEGLKPWASFRHDALPHNLGRRFSPDGQLLLVRMIGAQYPNPTLHLWNLQRRELHAIITCSEDAGAHGFSFSPDSKLLAVTDVIAAKPKQYDLSIVNLRTKQRMHTLKGHQNRIHAVAWSPDKLNIASGATWGEAKLWDAATGQELRALDSGSNLTYTSLAFSSDSRLVFGFQEIVNQLTAWETATGRCVFAITLPGEAVAYFGERQGRHVFAQWRQRGWVKWLKDRYIHDLPGWVWRWLDNGDMFNEFIAVDGQTGKWSVLLTLPAKIGRLDFLHVGDQVLAYRENEPRQIEWWDLNGGRRPWGKIALWATITAVVYWCLSAVRAWRRRAKSRPSAVPASAP